MTKTRKLWATIIFFIFGILLSRVLIYYNQTNTAEPPVPRPIEDIALENVIREIISKPEGELELEDISAIENIKAYDCGITDLSGIEYLTSLVTLAMPHNEITDITPLSALPDLSIVDLSNNRIEDFTPIGNLTNLNWLFIESNPVKNYNFLTGLSGLVYLNIVNTGVHDLTVITPETFPYLQKLELSLPEHSEERLKYTEHLSLLEAAGVIIEVR
jgi:Leucine-rich repeat (LRR) protein